MTIDAAEKIWLAAGAYLAAGAVFAALFVALGVRRMDAATKGAGLLFRLLIAPGTALLWPILLLMWVSGASANRRDAA
jgi:hypothetical protein